MKADKQLVKIVKLDLENQVRLLDTRFNLALFVQENDREATVRAFSRALGKNSQYIGQIASMREYSLPTYEHSLSTGVLGWAVDDFLRDHGHTFKEEVSPSDMILAGIYHDIGKKKVRKAVLESKGSFSEQEWEEMKEHTKKGEYVLDKLFRGKKIPHALMKAAARYHHEDLNGSGYEGLIDHKYQEQLQIITGADITHAAHLRIVDWQDPIPTQEMAEYLELGSLRPNENPLREKYLMEKLSELKTHEGKAMFKNLQTGKYDPKIIWPLIALLTDFKR